MKRECLSPSIEWGIQEEGKRGLARIILMCGMEKFLGREGQGWEALRSPIVEPQGRKRRGRNSVVFYPDVT